MAGPKIISELFGPQTWWEIFYTEKSYFWEDCISFCRVAFISLLFYILNTYSPLSKKVGRLEKRNYNEKRKKEEQWIEEGTDGR